MRIEYAFGVQRDRLLCLGLLLIALVLPGCSSVSIDAAKALATTGRDTALAAQKGAFASDEEFVRSMKSEALLHGVAASSQSSIYPQLLTAFEAIQGELRARAVTLQQLSAVYDAFQDLAAQDSGAQTETALAELGGAINAYATIVKASPPLTEAGIGIISKAGGLIAAEAQKRKLEEASRAIRGHVQAFTLLLGTPVVREQQVGFQKFMLTDRKVAIVQLWRAKLYDPAPLIDDIGTDVGLKARKDVVGVAAVSSDTMNGLEAIVELQLKRRGQQIERSYDATLSALKRLSAEHEKFEKGESMDLARIRAIVAQLQSIATLLAK